MQSYFGETIHWRDEKLNRWSAYLTFRIVKSSSSYYNLSRIIEEFTLTFALLRKWQWLQLIMVLNFLNPFESFEQESSNDRPIVSNRNRKRKRRWLVLYFPMKYIWFLCYRQYTRTIERGCFRNKWSRSRLWAIKNHHKQDLLLTAKIGC